MLSAIKSVMLPATDQAKLQILGKCIEEVLLNILLAHPNNAEETVPTWDRGFDSQRARRVYTDESGACLPRKFEDDEETEHIPAVVLVGSTYCSPSPDGCLSCGEVHIPEYFNWPYPRLALAQAIRVRDGRRAFDQWKQENQPEPVYTYQC
jgi:hypothetical protein